MESGAGDNLKQHHFEGEWRFIQNTKLKNSQVKTQMTEKIINGKSEFESTEI